jgi:hypothetical protein
LKKQIVLGIALFASLLVGSARADEALNFALFNAAEYDGWENVGALISKGANVNWKYNGPTELFGGFTPLHMAMTYVGGKKTAELLLSKGANVNAKTTQNGETPLHRASMCGNKEVAELLISKGADVNAKENHGLTPLHSAVFYGGHMKGIIAVMELLISKGADVNAKDNGGKTPLSFAKGISNKEIPEFLISKGAD